MNYIKQQKLVSFKEINFIIVARRAVFNRTVRYFGSLSGIKMIVIPDYACVL